MEVKALEGVARCAEPAGDRDAAAAELHQAVDLYRRRRGRLSRRAATFSAEPRWPSASVQRSSCLP